jgi:hypothetical protein
VTKSLDDIMSSGNGEAMPAPDATTEPTASAPVQTVAATPSEQTPAAPEKSVSHDPMVPLPALQEARREAREAREKAIALEAQMQAYMQSMQPKPEPKPVPDMFVDPQAFVQHQLDPVSAQIREVREEMSRNFAITRHGEPTVKAAYDALAEGMRNRDPEATRTYQVMMQSNDPYDGLVRWHKTNTARQKYGDDPDSYISKELERRLAEKMAEMQAGQPAVGASQAPVLPTNLAAARNAGPRSGVTYSGPKPLSEIMKR